MARIVEVRASAHSCPFKSNPVHLGLGTNTKREIVLVRIADESGAVSFGEAHHSQNPTAMATAIQDGPGYGIESDETVLERDPAIPGPCCIPGWAGG